MSSYYRDKDNYRDRDRGRDRDRRDSRQKDRSRKYHSRSRSRSGSRSGSDYDSYDEFVKKNSHSKQPHKGTRDYNQSSHSTSYNSNSGSNNNYNNNHNHNNTTNISNNRAGNSNYNSIGINFSANNFEYVVTTSESKLMLLQGLNPITTEETITECLKVYGAVEEVKIKREEYTGISKCIAYIIMSTLSDANCVMQYSNGFLLIDDFNTTINYAVPIVINSNNNNNNNNYNNNNKNNYNKNNNSSNSNNNNGEGKDWICPQCNITNFARRGICFQCKIKKPENAISVNTIHGEMQPTCILGVRGLDFNTVEDTLWDVFSVYGNIKEIRLIRDKVTQISRGFCFVEFIDVDHAINAMNHCNEIRVDNRFVRMIYTKGKHDNQHNNDNYYNQYFGNNRNNNSNNNNNVSGVGGIHQPFVIQDAIDIIKSKELTGFVFDATYGYYFHRLSGLYFNPKENYYWDSINQLYYRLDPLTQEYLPDNKDINNKDNDKDTTTNNNNTTNSNNKDNDETTTTTTGKSQDNNNSNTTTTINNNSNNNNNNNNDKNEKNEKIEINFKIKETNNKVKGTFQAKKLNINIERWSKLNKELTDTTNNETNNNTNNTNSTNKRKEQSGSWTTINDNNNNNNNDTDKSDNKTTEQTGETNNKDNNNNNNNNNTTETTTIRTNIVYTAQNYMEYKADPELEQTAGNICLLCKRQFASAETIKKHQALSELHKQNLEIARQKLYERKKEHLIHPPDHDNDINSNDYVVTTNSKPTPQDFTKGVGSKLLEKMGWKKGEGIGKQNIKNDLINVEIRPERAGLGSIETSGGLNAVLPGDLYHDAVKKRARARYDAISEDDDHNKRGKSQ